jgi:hypothetical protein
MEIFWKAAIAAGGLAAIGAYVFWANYQKILGLQIFAKLTRRQTFFVIIAIVVTTTIVCCLLIYAYLKISSEHQASFPITVYVHGPAGTGDMILKNSGYVLADFGPDRRREPIEDKGQAYFPSIPSNFRGQEVPISLDAEAFEVATPSQKYRLDGSDLYLLVRRKPGRVSGWVRDNKSQQVIGAVVTIGTNIVSSGASGHFDLSIPGEQLKPELSMQVTAPGYKLLNEFVVPNANEITITLERNP